MTKNLTDLETVTLSTGEKIPLTMPDMSILLPSIMAGEQKPWLQIIIMEGTKRPWEWYLKLSLIDGTAIIKGLSPALKAAADMVATLSSISTPPMTKH